MSLINTTDRFGSLTKLLHWSIFILFVGQFFLVYRHEYFPKGSPERSLYMMLHESIGVCLLVMAILMIVVRQFGTRPIFPLTMSPFEILLAKATHFVLYVLILWQPLSGMLMSTLGGYKVPFFGWYEFPLFLQENKPLAEFLFNTHVWASYAIMGVVALHSFAALYHHFYKKDFVLKRMLLG